MKPQIGIVGCGRPGRGQARGHVRGFSEAGCEVVALCDIALENAQGLRDGFGLTNARLYSDSNAMFAQEQLDIVSVCLWPHLHAPVTIAAAKSGRVRAVHCEKPVAPLWSEAKEMVRVCQEAGVQLTFNHQRRFNTPFQKARELIQSGEIGRLESMEGFCMDLFDWGTHWFDMMFFFNDETPVKWVLGQVETREAFALFGVPIEKLGMAHFEFQNEVRATLVGGRGDDVWNGLRLRVNGTKGSLDVGEARHKDGFSLRILSGASGWQGVPLEEHIHGDEAYPRVMAEIVASLQNGTRSRLDASYALQTAELIFAAYESARRRERVFLPLEGVEGHPLLAILREQGELPPNTLIG